MRKVTALAVFLLLALAMLGTGYAYWRDSLTINGTASMGTVDWVIKNFSIKDSPAMGTDFNASDDFASDPEFWDVGKNVASGEGGLTDGRHTFTFTLNNAYPGYFNEATIYPQNTGTIPIKIRKVRFFDNLGVEKASMVADGDPIRLDLSGDGVPDIDIWWLDNFGLTLKPGGSLLKGITFWVHVREAAPQGKALKYSIKFEASQWNAP